MTKIPENIKQLYNKAVSEAYSAYNDGWTQEHYKNIAEDLQKKYGEIGLLETEYDSSNINVTLPKNVVESLGIGYGDKLIWSVLSNGTCVLKKFNPENVTEVSGG